ncbi:MAG: hypothetical protein R3182_14110, partial [Draconibacterium sp.]|nr:hypothetical protein [Draconibacterium sp.]
MKSIFTFFLVTLFLFVINHPYGQKNSDFHKTTEWIFEPSLKFDALCLLNTLTGDSYYKQRYEETYEIFHKKFTPEIKTTLNNLYQIKQS